MKVLYGDKRGYVLRGGEARAIIAQAILESIGEGEGVRESLLSLRACHKIDGGCVDRTQGRLPRGYSDAMGYLIGVGALESRPKIVDSSRIGGEGRTIYIFSRGKNYDSVLERVNSEAEKLKKALAKQGGK
jgi:hypothetical protein